MKRLYITVGKTVIAFEYDNRKFALLKTKGLMQLIDLLVNPDKEVHCTMLQADDILRVWETFKDKEPAKELLLESESYTSFDSCRKEPVMDERYIREIKDELRRLTNELEKAKQESDLGKVEQCESEIFKLQGYLLANTDIFGRSKSMPREYEKAKDAVRKSLGTAFEDIREEDRSLSDLLSANIRVGEYCCYHSLPSLDVYVIYSKRIDKEFTGLKRVRKKPFRLPVIADLTKLFRRRGGIRIRTRLIPCNRRIV